MSNFLSSLTSGVQSSLGSLPTSLPQPVNGAGMVGKKKANPNGGPPLRQGKWTREEEEYVHCLIDEFKTGMMPLAEGTSLRTFLSKMLNCHPMRISKKFVGSNYNGKQVYTRRTGDDRLSNEEVKDRRAKLCDLERKFLEKIAPGSARRGAAVAGVPSLSMAAPLPQQQQSVPNNIMQSNGGGLSIQNLAQQQQQQSSSVSNSGIDLRNLINQAAVNHTTPGNNNPEIPASLDMLSGTNMSASSQSLQNLFQELVKSSSSHGGLNNTTAAAAPMANTDSMQAFQAMFQQQQGNQAAAAPKSNSRAAAAGRALLQGGGGLGLGLGGGHGHSSMKEPEPVAPMSQHKDIASFSSAELAAELRKRSSLQDIMASLASGGADSKPRAAPIRSNNFSASSLASLQDTLQQAAGATNANAFSSLLRNSAMDMSGLVERQGSIDSLSNLAIRSRLQSMQSSMGSLLDPLLEGANTNFSSAKNNSTWNPNAGGAPGTQMSLDNLKSLAAKVSQGNMEPRTATDLMHSLGMNHTSLGDLANATAGSDVARTLSASGLNLSSLLNNEEALRRLEASAPSSLHQNFTFQKEDSGAQKQELQSSSSDNNTAISQFLLQKQLSNNNGNASSNRNEQQRLMMNVAVANGDGAASGGNGGMDPAMMSTLLSQLRSAGAGTNGQELQQGDSLEALKRKFFGSQNTSATQEDEHRRNKPFRS